MFVKKYYPCGQIELHRVENQNRCGSSFDLDQWFFYEYDNKGIKKQDFFGIQIRGCVEISLSPHLMRGRKRTDLINQIFIGPVLMRSRAGRGTRIVSTHPLFCVIRYLTRIYFIVTVNGSFRFCANFCTYSNHLPEFSNPHLLQPAPL